MSRTIWKFIPEITDSINIEMPKGARVLHAEAHGDRQLQVWAEVNPNTYTTNRELRVYGTGHPMPDNPGRYISTTFSGPFVWHVYEPAATS